jgi:hypothetical protein
MTVTCQVPGSTKCHQQLVVRVLTGAALSQPGSTATSST